MRHLSEISTSWSAGSKVARSCRRLLPLLVLMSLMLSVLAACVTSSGSTTSTSTSSKKTLRYWVPGIFVVGLISNDGGLNTDNALGEVTNTIKAMLEQLGPSYSVQPLYANNQQASGNSPALMVFGQGSDNPVVGIASFELVNNDTKAAADDPALASAVLTINQAINPAKPQPVITNKGHVWIVGAVPDLLGSGASAWFVGGSPDDTPKAASSGAAWKPPSGGSLSRNHIKILDAAPPSGTQICLAEPGKLTDVPVTPTPGSECGFLKLKKTYIKIPEDIVATEYPAYASTPDGMLPSDTSFEQHGPFVAKIIQHLAPGADLELIRVLGNYGGTDLQSLINGLYTVYQGDQENLSHTVVNMSLTLQPPTECLPTIVDHFSDAENMGLFSTGADYSTCQNSVDSLDSSNKQANKQAARLFVPLGLIMEKMTQMGAALVASAGNESNSLGADMPGAYCGVYAVAAYKTTGKYGFTTPSDSDLASYSNKPSLDGGKCLNVPLGPASGTPYVFAEPISSGPTSSSLPAFATGRVCSLFMDTTNARYTNSSEMSWWSGTSFSAPVITAEIALGKRYGNGYYEQPCG